MFHDFEKPLPVPINEPEVVKEDEYDYDDEITSVATLVDVLFNAPSIEVFTVVIFKYFYAFFWW